MPYECRSRPIHLPVVDLSRKALSADRAGEISKLVDSFTGVGFCLVTGLEGYDTDALFRRDILDNRNLHVVACTVKSYWALTWET